jgi:hypothetical protein
MIDPPWLRKEEVMAKIKTSVKPCEKCDRPDKNVPTFLLDNSKRDFVSPLCPTHLHKKLREWEIEEEEEAAAKKREKNEKEANGASTTAGR